MKIKLVSLNIVLILINTIITLKLLSFTSLEYANYSEYIMMASYVGIFSVGLSAMFQRKVASLATNYSKIDVLLMFATLTLINIVVFVAVSMVTNFNTWYLVIIVVYNNYYLSKALLSISRKFNESKILEILERIIFLIIVYMVKNINLIILLDIVIKILFTIICYIRIAYIVNGDKLSYSITDILNGMMMMSGTWLLIVALNMDKQVMLSRGREEFGIYSMTLSLFLLLNSLVQPLRIYYFSNNKQDPSKLLNYVSVIFTVLAMLFTALLLSLNIFPDKEESLKVLLKVLWMLPMYIQININLINQMQLRHPNCFAIINLVVVLVSYIIINLVSFNITCVILFKGIILLILYLCYMKVLNKTNKYQLLFICLILFLLQVSILFGLIVVFIYVLKKVL